MTVNIESQQENAYELKLFAVCVGTQKTLIAEELAPFVPTDWDNVDIVYSEFDARAHELGGAQ